MTGLLEVAERLAPIIREFSDRTEADRKIAGPVIDALRKTSLARMTLPRADGGEGISLPDTVTIYERIAREDAAVAWVLWNSGLVTYFSRFMDPALRAEVFADHSALFCQSTRPMGTLEARGGSHFANGRWTLVSGCDHSEWAFLTCIAQQDGAPIMAAPDTPLMRIAALPKSQFEIVDTWHSSGLRGTGSHDVVVDGAEIAPHRVFEIGGVYEPRDVSDRVPIMSAVTALFAAQVLGVSQASCDHIIDRGRTEITSGPMPDMRDRPEALTGIAGHWAALKAARLGLHTAAEDVWTQAESGEDAGEESITALYAASMHAMAIAKTAMSDLHAIGGTRALYATSPLERRNRDLQAMLRHIVAQPVMLAYVGRSLFGAASQWPLYMT